MSCETWFDAWVEKHQLKFEPKVWMPASSARADFWRAALDRRHVTLDEANSASDVLAAQVAEGGRRLAKERHLNALLRRILEARDLKRAGIAKMPTREESEAKSRECVECAGSGLASRRLPANELYPYPHNVSFYCHLCEMGRWLKAKHQVDPQTRGKIVDLCDRRDLWGDSVPPGETGTLGPLRLIGEMEPLPSAGADATRAKFEQWRRQRGGAASPF